MSELHVPQAHLPECLTGLPFPATPDEAMDYARAHGASPGLLEVLESLPAAVFGSSSGLGHALMGLGHLTTLDHPLPRTFPSHDGNVS